MSSKSPSADMLLSELYQRSVREARHLDRKAWNTGGFSRREQAHDAAGVAGIGHNGYRALPRAVRQSTTQECRFEETSKTDPAVDLLRNIAAWSLCDQSLSKRAEVHVRIPISLNLPSWSAARLTTRSQRKSSSSRFSLGRCGVTRI